MEFFFLFLLFAIMIYALGSGFPVAFALPGAAILTISLAAATGYVLEGNPSAYFIQDGPIEWLTAGVTNFRGIYWEVERDTLIAIPLFIFMGIMLQRSRIAEDLLVTMAQLFGPIPGGLGVSVVCVGALLAATTGIVGATVVAMGLISLPAMLRNNYAKPLATGTICASGTLGQIIPPSIVLIILADQLANAVDVASSERKALYKKVTGEFSMPSDLDIVSTSAGDMFLGAFLPGLVLVGLYILYILITAFLRPASAPTVHYEGKLLTRNFLIKVMLALLPPLVLIFAVLGSIILGIATVNQAGAIGAIGATIMAGYRLKEGQKDAYYPAILGVLSLAVIFILTLIFDLNIQTFDGAADMIGLGLAVIAVVGFAAAVIWSICRAHAIEDTLKGVMLETAKTSSMVFIILLGAAMLTAAFRGFGGEEVVKDFLLQLPGGFWSQFIVVMAVIFVLGFFLDFIEIAVVVVPIVAPILLIDPSANVTAVWLGVMIGMNIQTSFLTPPFGFALFYLRGVADAAVRTIDIYKGVVPFIALQLIGLTIVGVTPALVNYLPTRTYLTGDIAPPPKNPRLQSCLENDLFPQYDAQRDDIIGEIAMLEVLDVSTMPQAHQKKLTRSFEDARKIFEAITAIRVAKAAYDKALPDYTVLHRETRMIERNIGRHQRHFDDLHDDYRATDDSSEKATITLEQETLLDAIADLEASISSEWDEADKVFRLLSDQVKKSERAYRRLADMSYANLADVLKYIGSAEELAGLSPRIIAAQAEVSAMAETGTDEIASLKTGLRKIAETSSIVDHLSDAEKALAADTPDQATAREALIKAANLTEVEITTRRRAYAAIGLALDNYELKIRHSIGLRQQIRLPIEVASGITGCLAAHRDISLRF